jgi:hypothetical protein
MSRNLPVRVDEICKNEKLAYHLGEISRNLPVCVDEICKNEKLACYLPVRVDDICKNKKLAYHLGENVGSSYDVTGPSYGNQ